MMNRIFLLSLFVTTICRAQQGIKFETVLSWPEVKNLASRQGKFIFIDAYKSSTGDFRDKNIFSKSEVGTFINDHFISFKIQADSSEFDKPQVKKNYAFAQEIRGLLSKGVFPAFLFFDPSGKIVHAAPLAQTMSPEKFLVEAGNALDTNKQYFRQIDLFQAGRLPYTYMPALFNKAQSLQDQKAQEIAQKYANDYVFGLPEKEQLSKVNIPMIASATKKSTDKGFALFKTKGGVIDNIIGMKGYSYNVVESVIVKELVQPTLTKGTQPSWSSIHQLINKRYGEYYADRIVLTKKMEWYNERKDWFGFTETFLAKTQKYGYDTSWMGKAILNNTIFNEIFKRSNNKTHLQQAGVVMEELIKSDTGKASWLDTYANLLYKLGDVSKAIEMEEKAVRLDPSDQELQQTLRSMKMGKPTWPVTMGSNALRTKWSDEVSLQDVLPEYPRPQFSRSNWVNLNGFWEYAITDSSINSSREYSGKILVPYPLESTLSKVKKILQPNERLWYRKVISLKEKQKEKKYLLHFGAVDYNATVFVNDQEVGRHTGGYQEFTFDISKAIKKGNNTIVVSVLDPTDQGNNPHGKQVLEPQGIMYTPTSGIWQTVWMETVPTVYIDDLILTPDIDNRVLRLLVNVKSASNDYSVEALAPNAGSVKGSPNTKLSLQIPEVHLWSPRDPFLYDLSVRLLYKGKVVDTIRSYFGMRKIEIKKDEKGQERIFLNNQYTFNMGVLDQGFWPDGIYTAPTDNALKFDIETIKAMGFNTIRKHIKIEPARWYYWCDKLGMLVWQDMPHPANLSAEAKAEFEKENEENIKQLYNYPSIVCWVLFNEGWNRYDQERLTSWMKKADPTRLVNGHSGENYDRKSPANVTEKWINSDMTDIHDYPGPDIAPYLPGKARVLGEWGGVRVATPGHQWDESKSWGYIESGAADFAKKYEFMAKHLKLFEEEGLSGAIYTQPFDVEIEENGLVTYDRKVFKIPMDQIKKINDIFLYKSNASDMTAVK